MLNLTGLSQPRIIDSCRYAHTMLRIVKTIRFTLWGPPFFFPTVSHAEPHGTDTA
jgi:hypothetical protein